MLKHARYTNGVSSGIFLTKSEELVGYIGWEGRRDYLFRSYKEI